jgi:hypothetical protein
MTFDPDAIGDQIREQSHFGPHAGEASLCPACGCRVPQLHRTNDDWMPELCTGCLLRRLKNTRRVVKPEAPRPKPCNRCGEKKPLAGAWCVECRDREQWKLIQAILATPARTRTEDQAAYLSSVCPHWSVWKAHRNELEAAGVWVEPLAK